jgi:signal peptidase I
VSSRKSAAAAPSPQPEPAPFRKSTLREYFEAMVTAVILAFFIRTFVVQAFKIPTGSMENNLLIGDHLLVNKFVDAPTPASRIERALLPFGTIKRGDVLVFKYPVEPDRDFIKRVIGLPGETVEVREKKVYIDGKALDEPYVHFLSSSGPEQFREITATDVRENFRAVTVPPDQYFMMGDNRDNSADSRYWGFLRRDLIKGKAVVIYWSYQSDREDYQAEGAGEVAKDLISTFAHFFTRTRWDRMFHQIR